MEKLALLARLEAKAGKAEAIEKFLKDALELAKKEEKMIGWYAFRINSSTFGIFDTFESEKDREAHLSAKIAQELMNRAAEWLSRPPIIEKIELLAIK